MAGFVTWRGQGWVVMACFVGSLGLATIHVNVVGRVNLWTAVIFFVTGIIVALVGWQLNPRRDPDEDEADDDEALYPGVLHTFQGFPVQYWAYLFFAIGGIMLLVSDMKMPPPK